MSRGGRGVESWTAGGSTCERYDASMGWMKRRGRKLEECEGWSGGWR